jgi:hypothetical protein
MIKAVSVDEAFEQLFDLVRRVHMALTQAGIEYRIVGGVAAFLHVNDIDPFAARLTRDVDVAIKSGDFDAVARIAERNGFGDADGKWLDARQNNGRRIVHLLSIGPGSSPSVTTKEGISLAPVSDTLRMKLTSFRLKNKVHIIDLDSVGLITPEIEQALPEALRARLDHVRKEERQSTGAE